MNTIERAYELADEFANRSDGYVGIRTCRYRFPYTNQVDIDFVLTAQALGQPVSFRNVEGLIARLEELLG